MKKTAFILFAIITLLAFSLVSCAVTTNPTQSTDIESDAPQSVGLTETTDSETLTEAPTAEENTTIATTDNTQNSNDASALIGVWEYITDAGTELTYEFREDGVIIIGSSYGDMEGTYRVEGDQLIATMTGIDDATTFEVNGDKLTLTDKDGGENIFTKKQQTASDITLAALQQAAESAGYETDDSSYSVVGEKEPVNGFEIGVLGEDGVFRVYITVLEFVSPNDAKACANDVNGEEGSNFRAYAYEKFCLYVTASDTTFETNLLTAYAASGWNFSK